jgi:hypothetical protein
MAIARDNSPEATRTNDERTPLIPPKDQAIREEDVDDPTQMPKGRRNMILVAVWLGVFVSLSLSPPTSFPSSDGPASNLML